MQLNLPFSEQKITVTDSGKQLIYDKLRCRYVTLTPEEWVRQNFVDYLINHKGYPRGRIGNEISLKLNGTSRRVDTLVTDAQGNPLVIVEYKAPSINISQRTFDQISRYNLVFGAPYVIVSNGMNHFCCHLDINTGLCRFLPEIPHYHNL